MRVQLHLVDPASHDLAALEAARGLLSSSELAYADRCRHPRRQAEFLIGRALLREVLGAALGRPPQEIDLRAARHGRPELAREDAGAPSFNLSHTQGLIVLACSPPGTHVGIDVEYRPRTLELARLARRHFSAQERVRWSRLEGDAARRAFFELWTLKEAYLKARGTGLSRPSHTFTFELGGGEVTAFLPEPEADADARAWRFVLDTPTPDHQLAVALWTQGGRHDPPRTPIVLTQHWPSS